MLQEFNHNYLRICSLNAHGAEDNFHYINIICNRYDIILLSKTWLLESGTYLFNNKNHNIFHHSSMQDLNFNGRPYGGIMFMTKKELTVNNNNNIVKFELINENITT